MLQQDPLDVGAFTVLENFIYGGGESLTLAARAGGSDNCSEL